MLIHHRLPAICCAILCTGALTLTIGSASTCQFLKLTSLESQELTSMSSSTSTYQQQYHNHPQPHPHPHPQPILDVQELDFFDPRLQHYLSANNLNDATTNTSSNRNSNRNTNNYGELSSYNTNHDDLGLFCSTTTAHESGNENGNPSSIISKISQGFTISSLCLLLLITILSWSIVIFVKPTPTNWKIISVLSIFTAGIEIPTNLFFMVPLCQSGVSTSSSTSSSSSIAASSNECTAGIGFFMLLWSILLLIAVTLVTQIFNYPEYIHVLDEWRVKLSDEYDNDEYDNDNDEYIDYEHGNNGDIGDRINNNNSNNNDNNNNQIERRERRIKEEAEENIGFIPTTNPTPSTTPTTHESIFKSIYHGVQSVFFRRNDAYVKHEIFQDYDHDNNHSFNIDQNHSQQHQHQHQHDQIDEEVGLTAVTNGNSIHHRNSSRSIVHQRQQHHRQQKRHIMKMDYLDTKSDSSRLLLRIGPNGKRIGDDQNNHNSSHHDQLSIHSFEVNLEEHSIATSKGYGSNHEGNNIDDDDDDDDDNSIKNGNGDYIRKEIASSTYTNYDVLPIVTTPQSSFSIKNVVPLEKEGMKEVMVVPAQFSPARRAATYSQLSPLQQQQQQQGHHEQQQREQEQDGIVIYPTQDLNREIIVYPTQQLRQSGGDNCSEKIPMGVCKQQSDKTKSKKHDSSSGVKQTNEILQDLEENLKSLLEPPQKDDKTQDLALPLQSQQVIIDMSLYKAMVAGTNAAEDSNNNYEEEEPEPVYYSSDEESETSSISNGTFETANQSDYLTTEDYQSGSYSDSDLEQTSKYLRKKLRRLRRKAERKKAAMKARKSPGSIHSVCSHISLTELTINEETDLDLELEDYSVDDNHTNVVSPLSIVGCGGSVKSSPAKFAYVQSNGQCIGTTNVLLNEYSNDNDGRMTRKRGESLQRIVPIVSPSSTDERDYLSEDGSLSSNARSARMNRIKTDLFKSRIRSKPRSEIVRGNNSLDLSYGSDEGSC